MDTSCFQIFAEQHVKREERKRTACLFHRIKVGAVYFCSALAYHIIASPRGRVHCNGCVFAYSVLAFLNDSIASLALPFRILSLANSTPCFSLRACPATSKSAAAFRTTKFSIGSEVDSLLSRRLSNVSEFSSGVPPATVESGVGFRPKTVGLIVRSVMVPSFRSQI